MTEENLSPYAGSLTPPPGAAQRSEVPRPPSVSRPGGLLGEGARVRVGGVLGRDDIVGTIVETGSVPAPHLVISRENHGVIVVFTGPGVWITSAARP